MGNIFLSIRGRVILNVEALNMTESVGNYVKHRRVPVIVPTESGFITYFSPAISGESIAHGFQEVLAQEAVKANLPVCNLCKKGIFLKSTNEKVLNEAFKGKDLDKEKDLEKFIIENCVVEDIGGFLYAEKENIKRTSNFYTGYMIPAKEALSNSVIESQLHSRYALGTPFVKEGEGQMIYYVELSSACYTFSFDFDSKYVSKLTFSYEKAGSDALNLEDRVKRIEVALESIKKFLTESLFGAKKTRFIPISSWESIALAVSDDVWTASSPFVAKYIENTAKKMKSISYNTKVYMYIEDKKLITEDVKKSVTLLESFEETIKSAIEDAKERVEGKKE